MTCTVIVGGQYGSEGKGKITSVAANEVNYPLVVRCGGPNSGHTVDYKGEKVILRQVPSCPGNDKALMLVSAGSIVDEDLLIEELEKIEVPKDRIIVDPMSILLDKKDGEYEESKLKYISSTLSGTGAASIRRISRQKDVKLVRDSEKIKKRCTVRNVANILQNTLSMEREVIVEGTQGFGLSILHSGNYPYVTSRDTTASEFIMEAGVPPGYVGEVIMVVRTFPIRVGGDSGPLKNEITWEEVRRISGAPKEFIEKTSVTKKVRRVAEFDIDEVERACRYNMPTKLAVMGIDRIDYRNTGVLKWKELTEEAKDFVKFVEGRTKVPVKFIGTGFRTSEVIVK